MNQERPEAKSSPNGKRATAGRWPGWGPLSLIARFAPRFRRIYSGILILVGWEVVAIVIGDSLFLPRFSRVLETTWKMLLSGQLVADSTASLYRSLIGFALALCLGIPLGILMGWFRRWDDFMKGQSGRRS